MFRDAWGVDGWVVILILVLGYIGWHFIAKLW